MIRSSVIGVLLLPLVVPAQVFTNAKAGLVDYSKSEIAPRKNCDALAKFKAKDIVEIHASTVAAVNNVPAYCKVTGTLSPEIAFEVSLPAKWNGRFYMIGNGGHAGEPMDDPGRVAQRNAALQLGFAFAQTNTGHDARKEPGAFSDAAALVDAWFDAWSAPERLGGLVAPGIAFWTILSWTTNVLATYCFLGSFGRETATLISTLLALYWLRRRCWRELAMLLLGVNGGNTWFWVLSRRHGRKRPIFEDPVKPIVFYIDSATPAKWVPFVKKGVESWQSALEAAGFRCFKPDGAYYVMTGIGEFGFEDDISFVRHLIEKIGVAAVPGSSFFADPRNGSQMVRFCFCKKYETLKEAEVRLSKLA